jgi:hypothetical protein
MSITWEPDTCGCKFLMNEKPGEQFVQIFDPDLAGYKTHLVERWICEEAIICAEHAHLPDPQSVLDTVVELNRAWNGVQTVDEG